MTAFLHRAPRRVVAILYLAALTTPATLAAQKLDLMGSALVSREDVRDVRPLSFLEQQLAHPRVRGAYARTAARVATVFGEAGVRSPAEIYLRVFKREQELEVWARDSAAATFRRVRTYPVCALSGGLGPKRREGDAQVPEGFYFIDVFNPRSDYHLSLRVDYPNPVDQVRGYRPSLGGDIYIHGGCATVGCLPVTDAWVEELYVIAAGARDRGQRRIPVHIFPTRLDDDGLRWLADSYGSDFVDYPFWHNLQQGYLAFERTRRLPRIGYDGPRYTVHTPLPALPTPRLSLMLGSAR